MKMLMILIFGLMFVIGWIDSIRGVLIPSIKIHFNVSYTSLATMMLLSSLGYIMATFTGGILTDKIGQRKVVFGGFIIISLSIWTISTANIYYIFVVFMFLLGYGIGLLTIGASTLAPVIFWKNQGVMMNLLHFFYGVGATIGPRYAGTLLNLDFTWGIVYRFTLIIVGIFLVYFLFCKFPQMKEQNEDEKLSLSIILRDKKVILFSLMLGFYVASEVGLGNWLVTYLQNGKGMDELKSASYLSLFFILFTCGRLIGGFIVEKIGYMKSIQFSILLAGLCLLAGMINGDSWIIMISISGIFFSIVYPTAMTMVIRAFDKGINTIIGVVMTSSSAINMITNWVIGKVNDIFNVSTGFSLIAVYLTLVLVFAMIIKKEIKQI